MVVVHTVTHVSVGACPASIKCVPLLVNATLSIQGMPRATMAGAVGWRVCEHWSGTAGRQHPARPVSEAASQVAFMIVEWIALHLSRARGPQTAALQRAGRPLALGRTRPGAWYEAVEIGRKHRSFTCIGQKRSCAQAGATRDKHASRRVERALGVGITLSRAWL